jgi:hypothetical protein
VARRTAVIFRRLQVIPYVDIEGISLPNRNVFSVSATTGNWVFRADDSTEIYKLMQAHLLIAKAQ